MPQATPSEQSLSSAQVGEIMDAIEVVLNRNSGYGKVEIEFVNGDMTRININLPRLPKHRTTVRT